MSKMISARIPDALYDQGGIELRQLGCSVSELVKSAYEYLLEEHRLPAKARPRNHERTLTGEQRAALAKSFGACTLGIQIPSDTAYDKKVIHEERAKRYEALA